MNARILNNYQQLNESLRSECEGKRVVCTIGSWDLPHEGHVAYLQEARELGDVLVVGVDSDRAYELYKQKKVVYPEKDRQKIVSAFRCVDYVTLIRDVDSSGVWKMGLIKAISPHLFVCNEKSYPLEQRSLIERLCPIEILSFHDPWTSLSAARSDAAREAYRLYIDRLTLADVVQVIEDKLRVALHSPPESEKQVQNEIETILNVAGIAFAREKERIVVGPKTYQPDFTLDQFHATLEVKLCNAPTRERELVSEINDDIMGYGRKYPQAVFIVYDQGAIRDVQQFKRAFERHCHVQVVVVKE